MAQPSVLGDLDAPPVPVAFSLRALQLESVRDLLRPDAAGAAPSSLGSSSSSAAGSAAAPAGSTDPWKILVLDRGARDMIAPLLKVHDLRRLGVTLHLQIHSRRERVPGAPAVYLCAPTRANVDRICADLGEGLYERTSLHFTSPLPRDLLESLASGALGKGATGSVARVCDEFLSFVSLESRLFALASAEPVAVKSDGSGGGGGAAAAAAAAPAPGSLAAVPGIESMAYAAAFADGIPDALVEARVNAAIEGLACVAVTLGTVPVIRAARGGAAEMIAHGVAQRLRDHTGPGGSGLLSGSTGFGDTHLHAPGVAARRPLLVIVDRNIDVTVPLHHSWVYQGLVHDVVGVRANRVTLDVRDDDEGGSGAVRTRTYDLEDADPFWRGTRHLPFPEVTSRADTALRSYREASEEIYRRTGASVNADGSVVSTDSVGASGLASAVMLLPKLTERKRLLDMHMNLATALMRSIKDRELNEYFSIEEALMSGGRTEINELIERLGPGGGGTPTDKLRLLIIYYATADRATPADVAACESAARESGCDLAALEYLKKARQHSRSFGYMHTTDAGELGGGGLRAPGSSGLGGGGGGGSGGGSSGGSGSGGGGSGDGDASSFLNLAKDMWGQSKEALKDATAAAKKWLPVERRLPLVQVVSQLVDGSVKGAGADFLYIDPKLPAGTPAPAPKQGRPPFREAVVFVFGGASYVEHQELQTYAQGRRDELSLIYGGDEMLSPDGFAKQLAICGGTRPHAGDDGAAGGGGIL
jgi:uncharacterized membrane protein YgcG